ncbi:hypothetical protein Pcinc_033825 [Petrolisthes cinctipes]|uniref:Diacylglycerol O-acyltransferase n=1 Tax=Petrolisthes cinctipes TaxID=88211 RepID=A0AAE1JYJ7_PETCI|nr:hypothetical protein Pcinc_033825 [Petrolisthes cinctipes]
MEGVTFPVEQRVYSWLLTNFSRPINATFFPFKPPSEILRYSWLQETLGSSDGTHKLPLQEASVGLLALLVLQECINSPVSILPYVTLGAKKCKLHLYNTIVVNILKTIIGLALMTVMVPVMLPFLAFFWLASLAVKLTYAISFGPSVTKAEGVDSVWGLELEESRPFITVCMLVSGEPNLEKIRTHIKTKVLDLKDETGNCRFRKFWQVFSVKCGYYCWRDVDNLNLNEHVRLINLSPQHHEATTRDQDHLNPNEHVRLLNLNPLQHEPTTRDQRVNGNPNPVARNDVMDSVVRKVVSDEGGVELKSDRPPWEVLILARDDNRYNVVLRLHHAIGDGVAFMRLCVETLIDTSLPPPNVGPKPPGPFIRAAMMLWSMTVLPLGLIQVVANFDRNSLHGPHLSGRKIMTWSRSLPLSVLRQVKMATHTTVNDVLMSCLASALARHFTRRKETVKQVTSVVPLSFHDLTTPLALTNCFSVATVKLPVTPTLSPLARLVATKRLLDGVKRDPTLLAVYWVVKTVSGVLPASVASLLLTGHGLTLGASNVPGPQQDISIWGDGVEEMVFWVPNRAPVGAGMSFLSYKGQVKVGLNVDEALVTSREEAQQLVDDVECELYRMHNTLFLKSSTL